MRKRKVPAPEAEDEDPFAFLDEEEDSAPVRTVTGPGGPWPEGVPTLAAGDVAYDGDGGDGGRRSLDWWLYWTFTSGVPSHRGKYIDDRADEVLREVLSERYGKKVKCLWTFVAYTFTHKKPSQKWLAACWNEAMSRLGYAIPRRLRKDPGV